MSSDESNDDTGSLLSLDSAFSPVDVPIQPANPPTPPPPPPAEDLAGEPSSAPASDPLSDSWKDEYDSRLANWRAESAETRAKAEAERARWEELRAAGKAPEHEWEAVGAGGASVAAESDTVISESTGTGGLGSGAEAHGSAADGVNAHAAEPSPADGRDLVTGEGNGGNGAEVLAQSTIGYPASAASIHTLESDASPVHLSGAELSTNEGVNTWEEIPSLASSFPSLPEQHNTNAIPMQPTYRPRAPPAKKEKQHRHSSHHSHPPAPVAPPSLTLTVFDSNVSTRTRIVALVSSIAINMFLPFVNGVMLGFGEIFARNVVGPWFGWPKPIATNVGVRAGTRESKRSPGSAVNDPFA
ncbi:hypothetical protein BDV93DRAFT_610971 [Ceratobasidium sp. AG-I]|nr:hypothetical protein BDV93DRAFT_610971 [Ceratobasidium sp. AG-I]